jgi:hypothetical protein
MDIKMNDNTMYYITIGKVPNKGVWQAVASIDYDDSVYDCENDSFCSESDLSPMDALRKLIVFIEYYDGQAKSLEDEHVYSVWDEKES